MSRFSVIYQSKKQYYHILCDTHSQATLILRQLYSKKKKTPVGIYDAKTELFYWDATRQQQFDQLSLQEQGKYGNEMIATAQRLRTHTEHDLLADDHIQSDVLQRPLSLL
ncbi:hypothetical protein GCM10027347_58250 [Larkinella harenae]